MATETRPTPISGFRGEQLALSTTLAALGIPQKRDTIQCRGVMLRGTADFRLQVCPRLRAFVKTADAGVTFTDYTDEVTDRDVSTVADLSSLNTLANGDYLLVGSDKPFGGIAIDVGNTNGNVSAMAVHYWNGAWTNATPTDGSANPAGTSLGKDGNVTWTPAADWAPSSINGQTRYWVRISFAAALDATVTIREASLLSKDANRAYLQGGVSYIVPLSAEDGGIEAIVAAGTPTLDVTWSYGDVLPGLAQAVALGGEGGQKVDLVAIGGTAPTAAGKVDVKAADGDLATLGSTTGAAVVTDANGTIQQYLRGLVKLLVDKITVLVQPFQAIKELGLTELIDKDDTEVSQNDYSKSVGVALGATMSGEILQISVYATELGSGAVPANSGYLLIFDADPAISAGDTAIGTVAKWQTVIAKVLVTDWKSDANGAVAVVDVPIPFHALSTLYFAFFNLGAAINDAAGDDEEIHINAWIRRDS